MEDILASLVGRQLSSVEFVQSYVQLRFDGPYLTIYKYPVVEIGEARYTGSSPGYRDMLCDRIATEVRSAAAVEGAELRVEFEDGARVVVPIRPDDDPEIAMYQDPLQGIAAVW